MSTLYASSNHSRVVAVGLALAVVATVLWAQIYPQVDALFIPLNLLTAQASATMLEFSGLPVTQEQTRLSHAGGFSCEIDYACTALIPVLLLAAAILAWRSTWRARLAGILGGAMLLLILNQLRLVSLVWLGVHAPAWFEMAHVWLWPGLLLAAASGYWYVWARALRVDAGYASRS